MNSIVIKPSKLNGIISVPPSKSLSHRAIICGSLCDDGGISNIDNVILSEDIKATIEGMRELGAIIEIIEKRNENYSLKIKRSNNIIKNSYIDCKESGSTLRFLIPIGLILSEKCTFTGSGNLIERPLDIYYKIFDQQKVSYKTNNNSLPLSVCGTLLCGDYEISGAISSQFISGLLFALPLLNNDSAIKIIDSMESKAYVDLTLDILRKFNIQIENINYKEFKIKGNSQYKSTSYTVEGDYSQAAFFLVANDIGNNINCLGLNENSLQGDKEIINLIEKYKNDNNNDEIIIDASQIPDLVPILTVLASLKSGKTTRIIKAERLRIKESDRLNAITCEMNKLGANIQEFKDGLLIKGQDSLKGNATVSSWNDHRIAMSLAIAATKCENEITLEDYKAVNKSYPSFWNDYKDLGGVINEFNVWK